MVLHRRALHRLGRHLVQVQARNHVRVNHRTPALVRLHEHAAIGMSLALVNSAPPHQRVHV